MTDLIERLRKHVNDRGGPAKDENGVAVGTAWQMMLDAADEIERLAQEITYLQGIIVDLDDRLAQAKGKSNAA